MAGISRLLRFNGNKAFHVMRPLKCMIASCIRVLLPKSCLRLKQISLSKTDFWTTLRLGPCVKPRYSGLRYSDPAVVTRITRCGPIQDTRDNQNHRDVTSHRDL